MCMYKVLIIEDEVWISALIRSILEEGVPSVQVMGEASNGQQALDMITRLQPDIVLTDINLPLLSGLEVIEQSKAAGFAGRFVVISGYNDFSYVQQALRFGVEDYLLKPIDDTELCALITQLTNTLDMAAKAKTTASQNSTILKAQLLNRLIMGKFMPMHTCNESCGAHFSEGMFSCAAVKFNAGCPAAKEKFSAQARELEQFLLKEVGGLCTEVVSIPRGAFLVLLLGYPAQAADAVQKGLERAGREYLCMYDDGHSPAASAVIGLSGVHEDFSVFQEACRRTIRAVNARCAMGSHMIYAADTYPDSPQGACTVTDMERAQLAEALEAPESDAALQWLQTHLAKAVEQDRVTNAEAFLLLPCAASLLEVFFETVSRKYPQTPIQRESYMGQIENCITVQDLQHYITELVRRVQADVQERKKSADHTIEHITAYISNHLTDTLSLEEVAAAVYLTPGYLSEYFKSRIGMNFKDYVLQLRMEQARQLLGKHGNVQDISQRCGYGDVKYFSKVFKKYYGVTPTEFRRIYG